MKAMILKNSITAVMPAFLHPHWERLEASPLGSRFAKGAFWSLVGTVISRSLSVLSSILVARMLGKEGMGELGIIQSTVGIFSAFAGLSMGLTATKYVAEHRQNDPLKAGAMLGLSAWVAWSSGLIMTVAMLICAPWFATHTLAAPHLAGLIQSGAVMLLLGAVNGAQNGALAGFEAFKTIARVNLFGGLANFPLMVGGVWLWGLKGAVLGLVAAQAAGCMVSHLALRREAAAAGVPQRAKMQPGQWHILWTFSLPGLLCNIFWGPVNWACNAIIVNQPNGYAEMGIYNATLSWFNAVSFLPGVLGQVILPLLASQTAEADKTNKRKIVALAVKANAITVVPVILILSITSPLVMSSYGSGFREGWPTLIVTLLTAGILAVQSPIIQAITASGRMWAVFATYVSYGLFFFVLTYAFDGWGAMGISGARCLAYIVNGLWASWFAYKYIWADTCPGNLPESLSI